MNILNEPPELAGQSSGVINWWDPDDPPVLVSDFTATEWTSVDISAGASQGLASGIYISAKPAGESLPSVKFAAKSSEDEILVDSYLSRVSPFLLRLNEGGTNIEVMLAEGDRPISILASGCQYYR